MTEQLLPGAFRVFDTVENRYVETEGFVLNRFGGLMALRNHPEYPAMVYICSNVADPDRYQVERWSGRGKIYAGDKAVIDGKEMFVYDDGCRFVFAEMGDDGRPKGKPICLSDFWTHNLKICGTIHDSPETLAAAAKAAKK